MEPNGKDASTLPQRVQRKRTKGWRMPENTVYVGRPSYFGNDWTVNDAGYYGVPAESRAQWAVNKFRAEVSQWMSWDSYFSKEITKLRGKNLACWCPLDQPCHADVLLEIAND